MVEMCTRSNKRVFTEKTSKNITFHQKYNLVDAIKHVKRRKQRGIWLVCMIRVENANNFHQILKIIRFTKAIFSFYFPMESFAWK